MPVVALQNEPSELVPQRLALRYLRQAIGNRVARGSPRREYARPRANSTAASAGAAWALASR